MRFVSECDLRYFDFGKGQAAMIAGSLTAKQLDQIDDILEEDARTREEPYTESEVIDLFAMEEDTIASWLGFADFEALVAYNADDNQAEATVRKFIKQRIDDLEAEDNHDDEDEQEEMMKLYGLLADEDDMTMADMVHSYRWELERGNYIEDALEQMLWEQL